MTWLHSKLKAWKDVKETWHFMWLTSVLPFQIGTLTLHGSALSSPRHSTGTRARIHGPLHCTSLKTTGDDCLKASDLSQEYFKSLVTSCGTILSVRFWPLRFVVSIWFESVGWKHQKIFLRWFQAKILFIHVPNRSWQCLERWGKFMVLSALCSSSFRQCVPLLKCGQPSCYLSY